jgi:hypothetical protein
MASVESAKRVLGSLQKPGSYLGVLLEDGRLLRFFRDKNSPLRVEIMREEEELARVATLNLPLAELLLEAAYAGEDLEGKIAFARLKWSTERKTCPTSR